MAKRTKEDFSKAVKGRTPRYANGGRIPDDWEPKVQNFDDGGGVALPEQPTPDSGVAMQEPSDGSADPMTGAPPPAGLDEFVAPEMQQAQYSTPGQQVKTAAEGVGKGIAGPLFTGAEKLAGVDPADIEGRENANPGIHYGAEMAGLVGPAVASLGGSSVLRGAAAFTQAGVLGRIGEAAAGAIGLGSDALKVATPLAKVGSAAVRGAIETAAYQSGDEASKAILGQYDGQSIGQAVEHAGANIMMSGLLGLGLGAGLGAVAPIWNASGAPKLGAFLGQFADHLNGTPLVLPETIENAIAKSGVTVAPELRAAMSGTPELSESFNTLREVKNPKIMEGIENLNNDTSKSMMDAIGKTPDDVHSYSEADQGRDAMETFKKEHAEKYAPIQKEYDELTGPFQNTELQRGSVVTMQTPETVSNPYLKPAYITIKNPGIADSIADNISQMAAKDGYATPGTPHSSIVNTVVNDVAQARNVQDLSNISTKINNLTSGVNNSHLWDLAGKMKSIILDGQHSAFEAAMSADGGSAELMNRFRNVRQAYGDFAKVNSEMGQTLGLGKTGGPKGFIKALTEKRSPEEFLRKLSPQGNAEIIPFLQKNFPETLEKVRENELYKLIKNPVLKGTEDAPINGKMLMAAIEKASPEMRDFALPQGALEKIQAAKTLQDALPAYKSSGTAGHVNSIFSQLPASAIAAVSAITGHNPVAGYIIGQLGKLMARDIPDATKLATLKFLGSTQPVEPQAFKSMADFIHYSMKGADAVTKATKNVFRAGTDVLSESQRPSEADRNKLDKILKAVQDNPQVLSQATGSVGHYMPEHAQGIAEAGSRAVSYLNALRPQTSLGGPLDRSIPPSKVAQATFNRALDIAQKPLSVIERIKDGSITPADLTTLKTLYPNLYQSMTTNLMKHVSDTVAKGQPIPYKTKVGLSIFMGQPLDSTMTPAAIMAAQPKPPMEQPGTPTQPQQNPKKSMNSLNKLPDQYKTPDQDSEGDKGNRR